MNRVKHWLHRRLARNALRVPKADLIGNRGEACFDSGLARVDIDVQRRDCLARGRFVHQPVDRANHDSRMGALAFARELSPIQAQIVFRG